MGHEGTRIIPKEGGAQTLLGVCSCMWDPCYGASLGMPDVAVVSLHFVTCLHARSAPCCLGMAVGRFAQPDKNPKPQAVSLTACMISKKGQGNRILYTAERTQTSFLRLVDRMIRVQEPSRRYRVKTLWFIGCCLGFRGSGLAGCSEYIHTVDDINPALP